MLKQFSVIKTNIQLRTLTLFCEELEPLNLLVLECFQQTEVFLWIYKRLLQKLKVIIAFSISPGSALLGHPSFHDAQGEAEQKEKNWPQDPLEAKQ